MPQTAPIPRQASSAALGAVVAIALAAAAGGCGGASKASASARSSTTAGSQPPGSTTATGARSAVSQARAIARQALLHLGDLPRGWVAGPRSVRSPDADLLRRLALCLHVSVARLREGGPREARSLRFKGPEGAGAESSVTVLASEAQARSYMSIFEEPAAGGCLSNVVGQALVRRLSSAARRGRVTGIRVGAVSARRLQFPRGGTQTAAYRLQLPIRGREAQISVTFDAVVLRVGPAYATFTFTGERRPLSAALERGVAARVAGRLQAALASAGTTR